MRASGGLALALAAMVAGGCAWRAIPPPAPAAPLLPCTTTDCLRVVSWNLHGIPFVAPNPIARLRNVAAKIHEQQPDVVLLQELWTHAYPHELARLLAGEYRVTTAVGCARPFPCGGLAVLVRNASGWVASAPTFVRFRARAPWYRFAEGDGFVRKGMMLLNLARGDETLGVVDTHLQSEYGRYGRDYSDLRRRQLEQLAWALTSVFGTRPVVVGGDLNTAPDEWTGLYESHVAPLGDDRTVAYRAGCGGCGTHRSLLKPPRWIDYLITRNLTAAGSLAPIANDAVDQPFSDHDGLLLRLDYDRRTLR
jgi:endonuclease/exonuclease/phosphatase family metal-dependent hydrolase